MIQAQRSGRFEWLFTEYNKRYLLRRHLHSFRVKGKVDGRPEGAPVLYLMNHCSWWDGLIVFHAVRHLSVRKHYMMMDEAQLKRYPFFRKLGAFSVDKTCLKGIRESLLYADSLLKQGKAVWLFPQGDIYHQELRPLKFQSGLSYLRERNPHSAIQPVTVYYSLERNQRTDVTLFFGEPRQGGDVSVATRKAEKEAWELRLTEQLDSHRRQVISGVAQTDGEWLQLLAPSRSINETFADFKRRVVKWRAFFGR